MNTDNTVAYRLVLGKHLEANDITASAPMEWLGTDHVGYPVACATIEELSETVFSTQSMPRGYQWDKFRI
jgi:hypothetical protein